MAHQREPNNKPKKKKDEEPEMKTGEEGSGDAEMRGSQHHEGGDWEHGVKQEEGEELVD